MGECDKRKVQRHIGYLLSLMEMEAWPDLVDAMIKFWDNNCMVFRFGDVELTPTLEEIIASYESVGMCNKRKPELDKDLLIPKILNSRETKVALSSVNVEWMGRLKGPNIPLRELYYRYGRINGYEKFREEFTSKEAWEEKRPFVFAICLLGTMVFPENRWHVIHPSIIMVTDAIFNGVEHGGSTKHYTLAPMILADIYRALDKCQDGSRFFQGCNLILQWWMMKHLLKTHNPIEPDPRRRSDQFASHSWWLHFNHIKPKNGQRFWLPILSKLRQEDIQWSIDGVTLSNTVVQSKELPFLVFAGLRGTRPYTPGRVLRQLGCKQVIPQASDMGKFATDHKDGQVSFARMMIREWKTRCMAAGKVPNRFNAECSSEYKRWSKRNIAKITKPRPKVPNSTKGFEVEDPASENYFTHRHLEDTEDMKRLMQELSSARRCIIELDDCMERQIQAMEKLDYKERAELAKDYLCENIYFIWHEVEAARKARVSKGAEAI